MSLCHVIKVRPGSEGDFAAAYGSRSYYPTRKVTRVSHGKQHEKDIAAIPGYVLIEECGLEDDPVLWEYVAGLPGFTRVLGKTPKHQLQRFLDELAKQEPAKKIFVPRAGQRVRLENGLYAGQIGKCIWANKKNVKIFFEGACNSIGAYLTIATEFVTPASTR